MLALLAVMSAPLMSAPLVTSLAGQETETVDETANKEKNESATTDAPQAVVGKAEKAADSASKNQPSKLIRLAKEGEVWLDMKNKRVIVGGTIVFRKGVLEMFACVKDTKEHESIVAVNAKAYQVHAALLAVSAKPGSPVQYDPEYKPASGQTIKVEVVWKDKDGKSHQRLAQQMVRNVRTQKQMEHEWVFAGSYFWTDEETGKKFYQAEGGELICVSNFSTATMDLPVESSQSTGQLLFEAMTDNIPPLETKVRLVLTPVPPPKLAQETPTAKVSSND
jgi:hypothetical protein